MHACNIAIYKCLQSQKKATLKRQELVLTTLIKLPCHTLCFVVIFVFFLIQMLLTFCYFWLISHVILCLKLHMHVTLLMLTVCIKYIRVRMYIVCGMQHRKLFHVHLKFKMFSEHNDIFSKDFYLKVYIYMCVCVCMHHRHHCRHRRCNCGVAYYCGISKINYFLSQVMYFTIFFSHLLCLV